MSDQKVPAVENNFDLLNRNINQMAMRVLTLENTLQQMYSYIETLYAKEIDTRRNMLKIMDELGVEPIKTDAWPEDANQNGEEVKSQERP